MKILFFLTISCIYLFAKPLTLPKALDLLKKQNLEIKVANYKIQSSNFNYDMVKAYDYGKLDLTQNIIRTDDAAKVFGFKLTSREASFRDFGLSSFNPTGGSNLLEVKPPDLNYPNSKQFFQTKLTFKLPIYTGNKLSAYKDIAKQMVNISMLEKENQLVVKIFELEKSYFDMATIENSLKNIKLIYANIAQLENITKEMITQGYAKKIDLLEVQSKKENAKRIITELNSNKELLYHYISFLLNETISSIEVPKHNLKLPNISTQEVLENNINIKKAMVLLKINENMITAQTAEYLPTIGAIAELQTANDSFLSNANDHKSYTIGLQLTWNLFSAGGNSAAVSKARTKVLKTKININLAKQQIALRVKEIQTRIKKENAIIKSLNFELLLAKRIYKNYQNRYKERLSSISDVIIKQSSWLEKILQLLKIKNNRNRQIFALKQLLGISTNGVK